MTWTTGFTTVTVRRSTPPREQQFEGRWLFVPDTEEDSWSHAEAEPDPEYARHTAATPAPPESWRGWIGETAQGRFVVYIHHWAYDAGTVEVFEVFDTFTAARAKFIGDKRIRDVEWDIAEENLRTFPRHIVERLDL